MADETQELHFVGEIGQKIILEREGKILLCRGVGSDTWDIPGGRLHKDEDPHEGLRREIREELGIEIKLGSPFHVHAVHHFSKQPPRYFVVFTAFMEDPESALTLATDEIEDIKWISEEDVDTIATMEGWRQTIKIYFARKRE